MIGEWQRDVIRAHLRSVRFIVWASLLAILAIGLALLPLLGVLGFPFAFALGIPGAVAAADLGAAFVRRARATERTGLERAVSAGRTVTRLWLVAAACHVALLLPPLVIISLNALRVRNCDFAFGLYCYLALPVLSSACGTSVGLFSGLIAGAHRRWSNALPYLFFAASVFWALWHFYAAPPVFVYNAFAGYFPGNLYDELIQLGTPFFWSRLFQLSVAIAAMAIVAFFLDVPTLTLRLRLRRPQTRRLVPAALGIVALACAALLGSRSGQLGFDVNAGDIQAELGGRYQTEHFVIYYPLGGDIARNIEAIAEDHEFRLWQVTRTFGVEPPARITSYYFADPDSKARWMGARHVHMAKPWRHEIYIDDWPFPHNTLRHELAHVIAGEFAGGWFDVSAQHILGMPLAFNVGLIEGTAVAADWPDHRSGELTPHQAVKALTELDMAPPVAKLMSPQFLAFSSARSYTVAGSFVRYILDTYGADRLRALYYTGGDFGAALGASRADVIAGWRAMIDQVELPPQALTRIKDAFHRGGIFERACPIAIARRRDRAAALVARGRLGQAIELIRRVCADAPNEPGYQLTLARLLSRTGDGDKARAIRTALAADDKGATSPVRAAALLDLAASAVARGDDAAARSALERAAALPLPEDQRRQVLATRFALDHQGPAREPLRAYFFGAADGRPIDPLLWMARAGLIALTEPALGMGHYLLGRNMANHGAPAETEAELARALDLGLPDPLLTRECARMLAAAAYLAGDDAQVLRAAVLLSAPEQPEVVRLLGADWRERVKWRAARR